MCVTRTSAHSCRFLHLGFLVRCFIFCWCGRGCICSDFHCGFYWTDDDDDEDEKQEKADTAKQEKDMKCDGYLVSVMNTLQYNIILPSGGAAVSTSSAACLCCCCLYWLMVNMLSKVDLERRIKNVAVFRLSFNSAMDRPRNNYSSSVRAPWSDKTREMKIGSDRGCCVIGNRNIHNQVGSSLFVLIPQPNRHKTRPIDRYQTGEINPRTRHATAQ